MKSKVILYLFLMYACTSKSINKINPNVFDQFEQINGKYVYSNYENSKIIPLEKLYVEPYYGKTKLTLDYNLKYEVIKDKSDSSFLERITLMKNGEKIKLINAVSFPSVSSQLGYVVADFEEYFVFGKGSGSGNPLELNIIQKSNGNSIENGNMVDIIEKEKVLLFLKNEEKLILKDFKNKNEIEINDFYDLKCTHIGGLRNCIEIDTLNSNSKFVTIKTNGEKNNFSKRYYR